VPWRTVTTKQPLRHRRKTGTSSQPAILVVTREDKMSADPEFAPDLPRPRIAAELQPKVGRLAGMRRLLLALVLAVGLAALAAQPAAAKVLQGTPGPNRLTGGNGDDVLLGGGGDDTLRGLRGDDTLVGGAGRDLLIGGPGDDVINARDGRRDTVSCGSRQDTVVADDRDVVPAGCEQVRYSAEPAPATGFTLYVNTVSSNNGSGVVHLLREHPTKFLPDCNALECIYSGLPAGTNVLIEPEADIGTAQSFGPGACAGAGSPCRVVMNQDQTVGVNWNGPG
jgi:hypothetical protein